MSENIDSKIKTKKWIKITVLLAIIASFLALYFVSIPAVKFGEEVIELGSEVPTDISYYLEGPIWVLNSAELDISMVNNNIEGNYRVFVDTFLSRYAYTFRVVDTTAPELNLKEIPSYLVIDKVYSPDDFVESTYDISGKTEVMFRINGEETKEYKVDYVGVHSFDIVCRDIAGNETVETINTKFVDAPRFVLLADRYIKAGDSFDPMKYVFAYDIYHGNLSDKITFDANDWNYNICDTPGDYVVSYSVTNKEGYETKQDITVHVCDKTDYNVDFNEEELALLCENGYFDINTLEAEASETAFEIVQNSCVSIYFENSDAGDFTSAVILNVTPNYVYILSNKHELTEYAEKEFIFNLPEGKSIKVSGEIMNSPSCDLAIIKIPVKMFDKIDLCSLKKANVKPELMDDIAADTKIFTVLRNGNSLEEYEIMSTNGTVVNPMFEFDNFDDMGFEYPVMELSYGISIGQHGSPVFDYYGNLVGINLELTNSNISKKTYAIRLKDVIDLFNVFDLTD